MACDFLQYSCIELNSTARETFELNFMARGTFYVELNLTVRKTFHIELNLTLRKTFHVELTPPPPPAN